MKHKKSIVFIIILFLIIVIPIVSFFGYLIYLYMTYEPGIAPLPNDLPDYINEKMSQTDKRLVLQKYDIKVKRGDKIELFYGVKNDLDETIDLSILPLNTKGQISGKESNQTGVWNGLGSTIGCYDAIDTDAIRNITRSQPYRKHFKYK